MNGGNKYVNEIMELERETCRRFQAGDIDWAINQFAEDFLLLNPGMDILEGKEHERAALEEASRMEGLELSWEPTAADVSASNDMAYVYGTIRMKMREAPEQFEKYVTIWKKVEGRWKLAIQITNSNK